MAASCHQIHCKSIVFITAKYYGSLLAWSVQVPPRTPVPECSLAFHLSFRKCLSYHIFFIYVLHSLTSNTAAGPPALNPITIWPRALKRAFWARHHLSSPARASGSRIQARRPRFDFARAPGGLVWARHYHFAFVRAPKKGISGTRPLSPMQFVPQSRPPGTEHTNFLRPCPSEGILGTDSSILTRSCPSR